MTREDLIEALVLLAPNEKVRERLALGSKLPELAQDVAVECLLHPIEPGDFNNAASRVKLVDYLRAWNRGKDLFPGSGDDQPR